MNRSRVWTVTKWGLLGVLGVWGILGAQEPAKVQGEGLRKNLFSQFASRAQWQMPVRVMDEIGVRPGMIVADVGAGDGWFTFYLAERVGASGRVIAEDIDADALEAVRLKCVREKTSNVLVQVGGMDDPKLPTGGVDLALMVNVLSALDEAKPFLRHLAEGLKPDGRLVIIEWDPAKIYPDMDRGAAASAVLQTLGRLEEAGFEAVKTLDFLPAQKIWICKARNGSEGIPTP